MNGKKVSFSKLRPTPSMVVALLALVVAVAGSAGAAAFKDQAKPHSAKTYHGNHGTIAAKSTKSRGTTAAKKKIKAKRGPTGLQGPTGAQGPAGAEGAQGPTGVDGATGPNSTVEGPKGAACNAVSDPNCKGPQGDPGQNGIAAKAYARVTGSSGAFSNSKNVNNVVRVGTGIYCIQLSNSVASPTRVVPTIDGGNGGSSTIKPAESAFAVAFDTADAGYAGAPACTPQSYGTTGIRVRTYTQTVSNGVLNNVAADHNFYFIVP